MMVEFNHYYVNNTQALEMINNYHNASKGKKNLILQETVDSLSYMVYSRLKGYRKQPYYNDLVQEGKIGLINAINSFNRERGINFFKIAQWYINNSINGYLKWYKRSSKKVSSEKLNSTPSGYQDGAYEVQEVLELVKDALMCLPFLDREIIILRYGIYGEFYSLQQLSDIFLLSIQRVHQIERRALSKIRRKITKKIY